MINILLIYNFYYTGPKKPRVEKLAANNETNVAIANGGTNEAGVLNPTFAPDLDRQISKTKL